MGRVGLCRVCLESAEVEPLFKTIKTIKTFNTKTCAEMISIISSVEAKQDDGFPQNICKKCLAKLKAAFKFKLLCENSQARLADGSFHAEKIFSNVAENPKNRENAFCDNCKNNYHPELTHICWYPKEEKLEKLEKSPYKCTHPGCTKAFRHRSRMHIHLKVHTDERNFICQYCSHAARDKQQLTVHIRYFHTKEKKFPCGECGKAFVSTQARYYHIKRHENVRNHHCPHCDKSFVFAFGLQEHLLTHTGEKRFACSLCDSKFSRKAHKEKHESRLHGIDKMPKKKAHAIASAEETL